MVARLRNRKGRIIGWSVLSVISLGMIALNLFWLNWMLTDLLHIESERMARALLFAIASLETLTLLLALGLAVAVGLLITELTVFTKSDLLVNLWDRVRALEQSQTVPANSQEPQSPASGGQPPCP
jgi:hypothetical protein